MCDVDTVLKCQRLINEYVRKQCSFTGRDFTVIEDKFKQNNVSGRDVFKIKEGNFGGFWCVDLHPNLTTYLTELGIGDNIATIRAALDLLIDDHHDFLYKELFSLSDDQETKLEKDLNALSLSQSSSKPDAPPSGKDEDYWRRLTSDQLEPSKEWENRTNDWLYQPITPEEKDHVAEWKRIQNDTIDCTSARMRQIIANALELDVGALDVLHPDKCEMLFLGLEQILAAFVGAKARTVLDRMTIVHYFIKFKIIEPMRAGIATRLDISPTLLDTYSEQDLRRIKFHLEKIQNEFVNNGATDDDGKKISILDRFSKISVKYFSDLKLEEQAVPMRQDLAAALGINRNLLKKVGVRILGRLQKKITYLKDQFEKAIANNRFGRLHHLDDDMKVTIMKEYLENDYQSEAQEKSEARAVPMRQELAAALEINQNVLKDVGVQILNRWQKKHSLTYLKAQFKKAIANNRFGRLQHLDDDMKMTIMKEYLDVYEPPPSSFNISIITPKMRDVREILLKERGQDEDGERVLVINLDPKVEGHAKFIEYVAESTNEAKRLPELFKEPFHKKNGNGQHLQCQGYNGSVKLIVATNMFDYLGELLEAHRNIINGQTLRSNVHGARPDPSSESKSSQASSNSSNHNNHHDSPGRGEATIFALVINSFEREPRIFQFSKSQNVRKDLDKRMVDVVDTGGMHLVIWRVGVNNRRQHGVSSGEGLRYSWVHRMNENADKYPTWDEWRNKVCSVFGAEFVEEK